MTWGLFVLLCMVVGWAGMIVFAIAEYFVNYIPVKLVIRNIKYVCCGLALFGFFIIALVAFG